MTELETKVNKIEGDQQSFEATVRMYMQKMDSEMQYLRNEMRDRDNQRHAEIMKLNQKFDERMTAMDKKFDERVTTLDKKFDERITILDKKFEERTTALDKRFDELTKHVQTLVSTTAVGVGGVAVALIVYLLTR